MGHLFALLPYPGRYAQPLLPDAVADILLPLLCAVVYSVVLVIPYALIIRGGLGLLSESSRSFGTACVAGYFLAVAQFFLVLSLYQICFLALWPVLILPVTAAVLAKTLAMRFPRALLLGVIINLLLAAFAGLVYALHWYINAS